jgi:hypothetical protein
LEAAASAGASTSALTDMIMPSRRLVPGLTAVPLGQFVD